MPKIPICKQCGKTFERRSSLQRTCSPKCEEKLREAKAKEKRKVEKLRKAVSVSALTKKADAVFSEYVRKRDFYLYGGKCVTCGQTFEYQQLQCGHFISRSRKAVRWNSQNAHAQCAKCNCWDAGRQYEHGIEIDRRYGEWTAQAILNVSNSDFRLTSEFLQNVISEYKWLLEIIEKKS